MSEFSPVAGEKSLTFLEAYDAMREFVLLNYGPLVTQSDGLANLVADTDRAIVPGGYPPDESTWDIWLKACERVQSRGV